MSNLGEDLVNNMDNNSWVLSRKKINDHFWEVILEAEKDSNN